MTAQDSLRVALSLIHVVNSTHILYLEHGNFHIIIIRYNVQFHLGDHLTNGTTFAKSLGWSV